MPRPSLVDLGNRRLKWARFDGAGGIEAPESFELFTGGRERLSAAAAWLAPRVEGAQVWVSSTRPTALEALQQGPLPPGRCVIAGPGNWPLPVRSRGTGTDRVLAAWAALGEAGGPLCVAGLGTAWTLDGVSAGGEFLGGAIGAGLGLQEAALAAAAPHLPRPAEEPAEGLPADSAGAVAAGTAGALAAALEALSGRWEEVLGGRAARFLTGGDAARLEPWLSAGWRLRPHLVLEGLARMVSAS